MMDKRGIEGLPLRLLVSSLVMALSAPALLGSLAYLDSMTAVDLAEREAEELRASAISAFVGGPGNVRRVHVELRSGLSGAPCLRLGGGEGDPRSHQIDVLWSGEMVGSVPLAEPGFAICTPQGLPLMIEGSGWVELSCLQGGEGPLVMAEMI